MEVALDRPELLWSLVVPRLHHMWTRTWTRTMGTGPNEPFLAPSDATDAAPLDKWRSVTVIMDAKTICDLFTIHMVKGHFVGPTTGQRDGDGDDDQQIKCRTMCRTLRLSLSVCGSLINKSIRFRSQQ